MATADPMDALILTKERIEARAKLLSDLQTHKWTETEYQTWQAELLRQGDAGLLTLQAFGELIAKAKAEGRYHDDVSPWFDNVRKRIPADRWVVPASEMPLSMEFARWLDRDSRLQEQPVQRSTEEPQYSPQTARIEMVRKPGMLVFDAAHRWSDACHRWHQEIEASGGISQEQGLGVLLGEALPEFLKPIYGNIRPIAAGYLQDGSPSVIRLATPEEINAKGTLTLQTRRWANWMMVRRIVWSRILRGDDWQTVPPLPGFLFWPPVPADVMSFNAMPYQQANSEAGAWLSATRDRILSDAGDIAARTAYERVKREIG